MKHNRFVILTVVSFSLIILASFKTPSKPTYMDKNMVFKVSYDASADKLVALEKLEVNSSLIQRNAEGKVMGIDKNSILSDMPMATRIQAEGMIGDNAVQMYALISFHSADKMAGSPPSDERMLEYLKIGQDSFNKHNFTGSDYSVSGKNWSCSGPSCGYSVPAGLDLYIWH
ncbi:MAG TPA: hypothetical protein VMZ03_09195 [Chitinophagaceae bacterium]|nr:hypothetical protein [Chitinophagaceae bacterium]